MAIEKIPELATELGTKFFGPFLVGMFLTLFLTKSVYLSLAGGAAVGFIAWLIL